MSNQTVNSNTETELSIYKSILLPIEWDHLDKDGDFDLVKKAIIIAKQNNNAKLTLLHVNVDYNNLYGGLIKIDTEAINRNIEAQNAIYFNVLKKQLEENNINYDFETIVVTGDVDTTIQEIVKEKSIDLVLMKHNKGFCSNIFSHCKKLINKSTTDVLVLN